jgi:integrase
MSQRGYVYRKNGFWCLRYRQDFLEAGQIVRKQVAVRLAEVCDRYRRKSDVADLIKEKLDSVQAAAKCPQSATEFNTYVRETYLPYVRLRKAASTAAAYETYLERYVLPRTAGSALRDITIKTVADLLESAAKMHGLNVETTKKVRSIISGIFTFAMSKGDVAARSQEDNPARCAMIAESAAKPKPTLCPTREQVQATLDYLDDLPLEQSAVALIGMAGLRPGEARAVRWEDWNRKESALHVHKSLWHTIESAPKTAQSVALVPVVPLLAEILAKLWKTQGSPISGRILSRPNGKPCNLDNMSKRTISARVSRCSVCQQAESAEHKGHQFQRDDKTSVPWYGFYSLRRFYGTEVRLKAGNSDTSSKALRNSRAVADRHYQKAVEVLPDVRMAANSAMSGLTGVHQLCTKTN